MHELLIRGVFFVAAGLALLSSLMVITQNNPVRCILFLVLTFFSASILWLLVEAEFLSLILILVYVGAVMTLFLFVVMMLNIDIEAQKMHYLRSAPLAFLVIALLTALVMKALPPGSFEGAIEVKPLLKVTAEASQHYEVKAAAVHQPASNSEALGLVLYTDYILAFELAAVLLLVAIISAVSLAQRSRHKRPKTQDVVAQIMTNPQDRLTLVSMKSEDFL